MDPPTTTTTPYPDSLDSSPRSRATDDDTFTTTTKLRLLCSYGGHIVPRPHDKTLCYISGDTRIVVVERTATLNDLLTRLSKTLLNNNRTFSLKYQLPNEDLDSLISISTEEDLDNMIDEYDRLISNSNSSKPGRIRLFLFPFISSSIGSVLDRSEDWFLNALNGTGTEAAIFLQRGLSDPASVNSLLGLDDKVHRHEFNIENLNLNLNLNNPDIHSVPDSPVIENSSSFGSTSSVGVGVQKQVAGLITGVSDDERSDHGVGVGYRKQQQTGVQPVMTSQAQMKQLGAELPSPDSVSSDSSLSNAISRQKPSIYQDPIAQLSSGNNRLPPNVIDPNTRVQMQQVSETGYQLPLQYDQHQQQLLQQQQQQHLQQQQQQQRQQQQQQQQQQQGQTQPQPQPQQFIPAGTHFVHHTPSGAVPLSSYYQVYPPQQQHHHPQYPFYYVNAGQPQAYTIPVQQPNLGETANSAPSNRPQTPPNPTIITSSSAYNQARSVPAPKPEMPGVYRTAGPQLVQVPASQSQPQSQSPSQHQLQHQFVGYSQIHHPSQPIAPNSATNAGYTYEFADQGHTQIYYTQPPPPTLATQYQAVNQGATMVLQDGSSQHGSDNLKQQIRSSQPS